MAEIGLNGGVGEFSIYLDQLMESRQTSPFKTFVKRTRSRQNKYNDVCIGPDLKWCEQKAGK